MTISWNVALALCLLSFAGFGAIYILVPEPHDRPTLFAMGASGCLIVVCMLMSVATH